MLFFFFVRSRTWVLLLLLKWCDVGAPTKYAFAREMQPAHAHAVWQGFGVGVVGEGGLEWDNSVVPMIFSTSTAKSRRCLRDTIVGCKPGTVLQSITEPRDSSFIVDPVGVAK